MKIHCLIENTCSSSELKSEHGLSLLIEAGGHRILFDTGASASFAENAECMGLDLNTVDSAILSHGHYDHGGGLERFLEINHKARVWASPHAFEPHFNASGKDIGLPPALQAHPRILLATAPVTELYPGITLHQGPQVPMQHPAPDAGMSTMREGNRIPDDFRHEQYLLIQEGDKRILLSGCSHRGILNIVQHFQPDILVGGFHLMKETDTGRIAQLAEALLPFPTVYYTAHCTGEWAANIMQQRMGSRLRTFSTGDCLYKALAETEKSKNQDSTSFTNPYYPCFHH